MGELIERFTRLPAAPRGWLFRGLGDDRFELRPSIGRLRAAADVRAAAVVRLERRLLAEFKRRALAHVEIRPESDLEWMVLGQHHGLPTRLLDWTESPLVAAFFAVEHGQTVSGRDQRSAPRIDAAVVAVPCPPVLASQRADPFKHRGTIAVRPRHISRRIPWQMGVFTIHHRPLEVWWPKSAERWVIPHRLRFRMKQELVGLGINRSLLFPDLEGLAGDLAWRIETGANAWAGAGAASRR